MRRLITNIWIALLGFSCAHGAVESHVVLAPDGSPTVVGWRGDGTGDYRGENPPLQWDQKTNILWSTELPSWSNGSPTRIGNIVFVTAEPTLLVAIDARSGRILWKRTNDYIGTLTKAELVEAKKLLAEGDAVAKQLSGKQRLLYRIKRKLRRGGGGDELAAQLGQLETEVNQLRATLQATDRLRPLPPMEFIGYSSSTPVSDGRFVYALFGNGVLSCFDMSGKRIWSSYVGEPMRPMKGHDRGHAASPILVGDKVIVGFGRLQALDAKTGRVAWTAMPYPHFGTPVHVSLGGATYVITPDGEAVRADDGTVMARGMGQLWYIGPLVIGDRIHFLGPGTMPEKSWLTPVKGNAVRLRSSGPKLSVTKLWNTSLVRDRFYGETVSHKGLIYAVSAEGFFVILDAKTGRALARTEVKTEGTPGRKAHYYASLVIAADHLFITNDVGTTLVLRTGSKPEEISRNKLGGEMRSSLHISGDRIYVRTFKTLYCIGLK